MKTQRQKRLYSEVSAENQTVLPREVCERLRISPGDRLRYIFCDSGVRIEKASGQKDDPFATYSEWAGEADEMSYRDL